MSHSQPPHSEPPLYVKQVKVHPRAIDGTFRRLKWLTLGLLLSLFYVVPWLRWDRGVGVPDQALLFDFAAMRAYFLGLEIWPEEFTLLVGLLVLASLGLFLATTLFGRIWCGYACPQTLWTDLFVWIETRIEGDRNARIRLERSPWTIGKIVKKAVKHAAWLVVSALTGGVFVFYFTDAPSALVRLVGGEGSTELYGFFGLFTATTYLLAGWAREQVCIYMCPWPRIQAAMLDEQSTIVAYDSGRGEARGHARIGASFEGRGHCVDCNLCVQVCPTGIDIRDGLQLACIGCGLCVDACNSVMERFALPKNLVGWTGKGRLLRPRVLVYGGLMLAVILGLGVALTHRTMLDVTVLRDRSPVSIMLADGSARNGYTVKIINRERRPLEVDLSLAGLGDGTMTIIGQPLPHLPLFRLHVAPDSIDSYRVLVTARGESRPVAFEVRDSASGRTASHASVFIVGGN